MTCCSGFRFWIFLGFCYNQVLSSSTFLHRLNQLHSCCSSSFVPLLFFLCVAILLPLYRRSSPFVPPFFSLCANVLLSLCCRPFPFSAELENLLPKSRKRRSIAELQVAASNPNIQARWNGHDGGLRMFSFSSRFLVKWYAMVEHEFRLVIKSPKTPPTRSNASSEGSTIGISPDVVCSLHSKTRFKRRSVEDRNLGSNNW